MKKFLILIFLYFFQIKPDLLAGNWELVDNSLDSIDGHQTSINFKDIDCADKFNCISFGDFWAFPMNRITTDGGNTWLTTFRDSLRKSYYPVAVDYPDTNLCISVIGKEYIDTANILRSTDKGLTWTDTVKIPCFIGNGFRTSIELDMFNTKVGGFTNRLDFFITDDGGLSWSKLNINLPDSIQRLYIENIFFLDENTIFAITYSNGINEKIRFIETIKSSDKGKNWEILFIKIQNFNKYGPYNPWNEYYPSDIVFIDEKSGWVAGGGTFIDTVNYYRRDWIAKTTDGGYTWATQLDSSASYGGISHLYFADSLNGYAIGNRGPFYWWTNDGGKKWTLENMNSIELWMTLVSFAVPSPNVIYAISDYPIGSIYKYSATTDVPRNETINNFDFKIIPNVMSSGESFDIDFILKEYSKIEFLIYTSSGAIIEKSVTYYLNSGSHTIRNSSMNNISSGLYWVKMIINDSEFIVQPIIVTN